LQIIFFNFSSNSSRRSLKVFYAPLNCAEGRLGTSWNPKSNLPKVRAGNRGEGEATLFSAFSLTQTAAKANEDVLLSPFTARIYDEGEPIEKHFSFHEF
jgi:hypothetical protein